MCVCEVDGTDVYVVETHSHFKLLSTILPFLYRKLQIFFKVDLDQYCFSVTIVTTFSYSMPGFSNFQFSYIGQYYIHIYIHTHIHTHIHTYTPAYIHTLIYTYTIHTILMKSTRLNLLIIPLLPALPTIPLLSTVPLLPYNSTIT